MLALRIHLASEWANEDLFNSLDRHQTVAVVGDKTRGTEPTVPPFGRGADQLVRIIATHWWELAAINVELWIV
jgi:hypothetical protein